MRFQILKGPKDQKLNKSTGIPKVKEFYSTLPNVLRKCLEVSIKKDKDEESFIKLISSMLAFGAMMSDVKLQIRENEVVYPFQILMLIGPAASGKSSMKIGETVFNVHSDYVNKESKMVIRRMILEHSTWKNCMKKCKDDDCNCGDEPEIPKEKILNVTSSITSNKLVNTMKINEPFGTFMFDSELDCATQIDKQHDRGLSSFLRKAAEHESSGVHTFSRGDEKIDTPKIACLLSGTPNQYINFVGNSEDGMYSRALYIFLNYQGYKGLSESNTDIDYDAYFNQNTRPYIESVSRYFIGNKFRMYLDINQCKMIDEYFSSVIEDIPNDDDTPERSGILRLRKILIRLIMILSALEACHENFTGSTYPCKTFHVELVLSWADFFLRQNQRAFDLLPDPNLESTRKKQAALKYLADSLPAYFSHSEGYAIANKLNGMSKSTFKRRLEDLTKSGIIKKDGHGSYHKVDDDDDDID